MSIHNCSTSPLTKEELTNLIFDTTYAMNLNGEENLKLYDFLKLEYIALFEGKENRAYDDEVGPNNPFKYAHKIFAAGRKPVGKITVGAGFNMDRPTARQEWEEIFGDELNFDDVYRGKRISDSDILKLLKGSVEPREKELARIYKDIWDFMRPNEKIAILSAYYNCPGLVNQKTNFFDDMKDYINKSDPKYLDKAVIELGEKSKKDPNLLPRRRLEAKLLNSKNSPYYTLPKKDIKLNGPIKVIPGKTVLPRGIEQIVPADAGSGFVIWRTLLDVKVRPSHLRMEGKVYRKEEALEFKSNPENKECRCQLIDVPRNLIIVNEKNQALSLNSWIRYGGASYITLKL